MQRRAVAAAAAVIALIGALTATTAGAQETTLRCAGEPATHTYADATINGARATIRPSASHIGPVVVNANGAPAKIEVWIYGTDQDDIICGSSGPDVVRASGGNDRVWTGRGDDTILGGDGDDVLRGGPGDDRIIGDEHLDWNFQHVAWGNDRIWGGAGDDWMMGGPGFDKLFGWAGDDTLIASWTFSYNVPITPENPRGGEAVVQDEADRNVVIGGAGHDWVYLGSPRDRFEGDVCLLAWVAWPVGFPERAPTIDC